MSKSKSLRICNQGHSYYKSTDCPTCPVCEEERKPGNGFLSLLAAPARRALENIGATTPQRLAGFTEKEILNLHGMGKTSTPVLHETLNNYGLTFKHEKE